MKPWNADASDINPDEIPENYIFRNQTINDYLDASSHDRKLFLIGSKGCGKTLLLRYKAYKYWRRMEAEGNPKAVVSGSKELVESLSISVPTLRENDIKYLADIVLWQKIWRFAVTLLTLRRVGIELIEQLEHLNKAFLHHYSLSAIVSKLISHPDQYLRKSGFEDDLMELSGMLGMVNQPFVLFVDRLDQALDNLLSDESYKYLDSMEGKSIPFKVWQASQYGLLHTSYDITTGSNGHIKIFVTARKEALDVQSQVSPNVKSFCTTLDYTKEELFEIFSNNVRNTSRKYLFEDAEKAEVSKAFFGVTEMKHPHAKDEYEQPRTENVFDFLYRHTFGRPREIIQMGGLIYDKLLTRKDFKEKPQQDRIQMIRRVVNEASYEIILKNYYTEIVPPFREEYVEAMAESFGKNLIDRKMFEQVEIEQMHYLHRIGLLGYVSKGHQHFLPASMYIQNHHMRVPNSSYYVFHPTLDPLFMSKCKEHSFYSDFCIIGNGYPFYPPVVPKYSGGKLEDLMPNVIPGEGTNEDRWKRKNIFVTPEDLFKAYFQLDKIGELNEDAYRPRKMVRRALSILTNVAHITALKVVMNRFHLDKDNNYAKKLAILKDRLQSKANYYQYTAEIKEINPATISSFENRLMGRIISIGIFIYLTGFDYNRIKQVVQHCLIDTSENVDVEDSAVRFLRKAFFISNLPNNYTEAINDRKAVLDGAASYERELLRDWWVNYKEHYLYEENIFSKEELTYLQSFMNNRYSL